MNRYLQCWVIVPTNARYWWKDKTKRIKARLDLEAIDLILEGKDSQTITLLTSGKEVIVDEPFDFMTDLLEKWDDENNQGNWFWTGNRDRNRCSS